MEVTRHRTLVLRVSYYSDMRSLWFTLLGLALIQGNSALSPIPVLEEEWEEFGRMLRDPAYRLPTTTAPRHYEVSLTPYFESVPSGIEPFTFNGEVTIYVSAIRENVQEIVMHCNDLVIESLKIETESNDVITEVQFSNETNLECEMPYAFLRIQLQEPLQINQEYRAKITFRGNINNSMRGFYRSWYIDSTNQKRWMGTTQFQPGHARQAFPCYDEPGFKATFDITIHREEDFSETISNMPIKTTSYNTITGRVSETFYTTPKTSTYLLAFIVSHYDKIATNNDIVRPFDIYARDNAKPFGDWALTMGEKLLATMEDYTQISYYTVADNMNMKQAAIPDFSAGAMENWGLLTYREANVLYDPMNSNHFNKQRVANIVAHEIAHMWFGNLVTCAWWDNLWLNEGFARFYQYFLTELVDSDMGYSTRFIVEQLQTSMYSDSVDSAHALTDPSVNDPTAVSAHFSTITYARGASVLRMTQYLLGQQTFLKALRKYLSDRKFDVAEPEHLFEAFDRAAIEDGALTQYSGITISNYFKTWSQKAGHPLLTVTVDQKTGKISITQARWERNTGVSTQSGLWHVPITWTRANDLDFEDLKPSHIITEQATVIDRGSTGLEWVLFNKQQSGFYRVNYDDINWALITKALRSDNRTLIHEYNRAQIVDDLFTLARAGVLPYKKAFNVLSFLEFEDQYAPWLAAISDFAFVLRRIAHEDSALKQIQEYIVQLSAAATARLGYNEIDGEPFMDGLLRMYLLEFLCNNGHEECITAGKSNFASWKNGNYLPPNMRPWVYCVGLREGDASDFDYFWNRYLNEDLASEKVVMIGVAGCTLDEPSLYKYLDAIVAGDDSIRPQDYASAINAAISNNEENTLRAFAWLKNNVEKVEEAFGSTATPLSYIAARLLKEEDIKEFEAWLEQNKDSIGSAYNTGINGAASARSNLEWSSKRLPDIYSFLETGYEEVVIEAIEESEEVEEIDVTTETPEEETDSANISALSSFTLVITMAISLLF